MRCAIFKEAEEEIKRFLSTIVSSSLPVKVERCGINKLSIFAVKLEDLQ